MLRKYTDPVPECYLESDSNSRIGIETKLFYENEAAIELLGVGGVDDEWRYETCQHGQIKKHPTDCAKYLVCSFGAYKQEQSCANGLHFNEVRIVCR